MKSFTHRILLLATLLGLGIHVPAPAQPANDGSAVALPRRGSSGSSQMQKAMDRIEQDTNDPQARERVNREQQNRAIAESEAVARQREAERRAEEKRREDLARKQETVVARPAVPATGSGNTAGGAACDAQFESLRSARAKLPGGGVEWGFFGSANQRADVEGRVIAGITGGVIGNAAIEALVPALAGLPRGPERLSHAGYLREYMREASKLSVSMSGKADVRQSIVAAEFAFSSCIAGARLAQLEGQRSGPTQLTAVAPNKASPATPRDAPASPGVRPPPHIEFKVDRPGIAWDWDFTEKERLQKKAEADEEARKQRELRDQKKRRDSAGGGNCGSLLRALHAEVLSGRGDEASKARLLGARQKKVFTENCRTDANASQMVAEAEQMIRTGRLPAHLKDGAATPVSAELIKVCEGNYQGMRRGVEGLQMSADDKNRMLAEQTLAVFRGRCAAVPGADELVAAATRMLERLGIGAGGGNISSPGNTSSRSRRGHVADAVANHCLHPIEGGGFQNSCPFTVHFKYCVVRPKAETWSDSLDCNKNQTGDNSVAAYDRTGGFSQGAMVHWAACKYGERNAEGKRIGYSPTDVQWDSRQGRLTFRCTEW